MKKALLLSLAILSCISITYAQDTKDTYLNKVKTLDSTIETLYSVISGPKGEARNWELFKYLFSEDAKLIPSGTNRQNVMGYRYLSLDDYIQSSGKWLEENGFFEKELHRKVEQFGSLIHVWSTYESFKNEKDTQAFARGINSIQLLYDGVRYRIINIYWAGENELNPIPENYLPH
jgi:hypothetical protein